MTNQAPYTYFDCLEEFSTRSTTLPWQARENTNVWCGVGETFTVELYGSIIATLYGDGTVTLHRQGFKSFTTRNRMNDVTVPLGYRVKIQNGEWVLVRITDGGTIPFSDGMILRPIPGSPVTRQMNR